MSADEQWVETETGPRSYALLDGQTAQNLTGKTVAMLMKNRDGVEIDTAADVVVTDAVAGIVTFNPDSSDFAASGSPYLVRFKVTDGAGKDRYYPSSPLHWYVHPL